MKVLFMVFHFPPISGGGVVVIVELANALAKLGHEITILTPELEWEGEIYNPKIDSSIKVIRVKVPSAANLKIAARRCYTSMKQRAIKEGKENNYDFILSIFHPFHLVPKAAVHAGSELKIPSLIKVDDAIYEKANGIKKIQRKIEKIYNSRTLKRATKIFVSNDESLEIVSSYYNIPRKKISIIPNGVDLAKFNTKISKNKNIVFSGAMYYHRGIDMLLDTVSNVTKHHNDCRFVLIGDGPEKKKLEKFVEDENIKDFVIFRGWIDREDVPKNLAESLIGIGPLRLTDVTKGALPIKVLEYMASSLPIIAIKDTLPSNLLHQNENGFFISNAKELEEKIVYLLNNKEKLNAFGVKSRMMVKEYDWKNIVEKIIQEYNYIDKN